MSLPRSHAGTPLIALISGVPAAIAPASEAVTALLPHATVWNILDDRLISDAVKQGGVAPALDARMSGLIDHAILAGADAILITCSLYAHLADRQISNVPLLSSDASAFRAVLQLAPTRVLLVSSVEVALDDSTRRLSEAASRAAHALNIQPVHVPAAREPARNGDFAQVAGAVADRVAPLQRPGDIVLFGQYSLSPAAPATAQLLHVPVIAPPERAAASLARMLQPTESEMT